MALNKHKMTLKQRKLGLKLFGLLKYIYFFYIVMQLWSDEKAY